jgi:hypothetical protein
MNDLHEPHFAHEPGREPLDRLVEAFVDLSVPEGPDQAIQLRLVATLTSASMQHERASQFGDHSTEAKRWRLGARVGSYAALAAALVGIVATTLFFASRREETAGPIAPVNDLALHDVAPESSTSLRERLLAAIDEQLRERGSDALVRPDWTPLLDAVIKDSKTASWRRTQQRLAGALEQPEVIGVGVGLLGTLPWASYGRF